MRLCRVNNVEQCYVELLYAAIDVLKVYAKD